MAAFRATYSDLKLIKTRQCVQIVFELPLADFDAAYTVLGGMPNPANETWFGIAPLKTEKEIKQPAAIESPAKLQPDTDKPSAGAKRAWETIQPAQQAGIRSHDIRFAKFLEEEYPQHWRELQDAADCIRSICGAHSRAELGTDHRKRVLWNQLDKHYLAWDAKVRLNA